MEDDAIRSGFQQLRIGRDYNGLHQSALCRAKADWLVGINATRYFSLTYGRTLNIGRVMSPTLALLVQREAEISAFVAEPFCTVQLDCGFPATTDRMKEDVYKRQNVGVAEILFRFLDDGGEYLIVQRLRGNVVVGIAALHILADVA